MDEEAPAAAPRGNGLTPAKKDPALEEMLGRARAAGGRSAPRAPVASHDSASRPVVPAPGSPAPFLGRSVLVLPGAPAPEAWSGCRRVTLGPDAAAGTLLELEDAFLDRRPLVIEVPPGLVACL